MGLGSMIRLISGLNAASEGFRRTKIDLFAWAVLIPINDDPRGNDQPPTHAALHDASAAGFYRKMPAVAARRAYQIRKPITTSVMTNTTMIEPKFMLPAEPNAGII